MIMMPWWSMHCVANRKVKNTFDVNNSDAFILKLASHAARTENLKFSLHAADLQQQHAFCVLRAHDLKLGIAQKNGRTGIVLRLHTQRVVVRALS
jgi:hypothetical protein